MTALINIHPFPLFITIDEMWASLEWGGLHDTLDLRARPSSLSPSSRSRATSTT